MNTEANGTLAQVAQISQQLQALQRRVDQLESVEAIRALRARYHMLVNEDQGPRLHELFAEDASVIYNGRPEVVGREAIRSFFENFPVQYARQFIHQHEVSVDGDTGTGQSYLDGRPVHGGKSFYVVGRFDDTYVRIDGRWLFKKVALTVHYMVEAAEHWEALLPVKKNAEAA